ncbi:MAG: SDR family oxidoreductase [Candidatus Zapsychrus exili]|nr:SDR family oxidoreductase [Candidatus Zapsychrus exili]
MDENRQENGKYASEKEVEDAILLLNSFVDNSEQLALLSHEQRIELLTAAGKLSRPDKIETRKRIGDIKHIKKQRVINKDKKARQATGIRRAREEEVFSAPLEMLEGSSEHQEQAPELNSPRNCYVCKEEYTKLHSFYDAMCSKCGDLNYKKRFQTASLKGKTALITGSRLKIGYQASLMMLRAGAIVIASTRFPVDSALRFSKESDFNQWGDRLHIYGLDLRHTPSVEIFCNFIEQTYNRLDLLINNAAQTVRRPPGFYAHLMEKETSPINEFPKEVQQLLGHYQECKDKLISSTKQGSLKGKSLPVTWNGNLQGVGLCASAQLSQIPYRYDHNLPVEKVFPKGKLDADLQQVDLRKTNSWRLRLGEVSTSEMFEIQLVNAIAPFVLCNRLSIMMKRDNTGQKHIVNVSAMEGKFLRFKKADRHPHTNMAKAALNMLTHTSASELAKHGIYMNAVDTGWVTDEDPVALAAYKQEKHDFQPPLDIVDGAARVCDPFFDGILTGKHWCGKFLKDYQPIDW